MEVVSMEDFKREAKKRVFKEKVKTKIQNGKEWCMRNKDVYKRQLEDLGKGLRSQVGTMYGTLAKGPRYLEMAEGLSLIHI